MKKSMNTGKNSGMKYDFSSSHLSKGNTAFQKGQYSLAIEHYIQAKLERPEMAAIIDMNLKLAHQRRAAQDQSSNLAIVPNMPPPPAAELDQAATPVMHDEQAASNEAFSTGMAAAINMNLKLEPQRLMTQDRGDDLTIIVPNVPNTPVTEPEQAPSPAIRNKQASSIEALSTGEVDGSKNLIEKHKQILKDSQLFDEAFYLNEYPDISSCASPLEHYLLYGGFEGRAASKDFDSKRYLEENPDVFDKNINPLIHYLTIGRFRNREAYKYGHKISVQQAPTSASSQELEPLKGRISVRQAPTSASPQELELLSSSWLFDKNHYLKKYPDVATSHYSPEEHFLLIGGPEGREASPYFNCAPYLETYEDIKRAGINPLIHYLMFGQKEGRTAFEVELEMGSFLRAAHSKKTVVLDNLPTPAKADYKRYRCALLIHAFYFDVFQEVFSLIKNLPFSKIIVTTTKENYENICSFLEEHWPANYRVSIIQENKGRDIAPFLNDNVDNLFDFDFVCKVHTKKSPHLDTFGNNWKRHLIDNLVGSRAIFDKVVSLFIHNPQLGIAYPEPMAGTNNYDWATNKELGLEILHKLGLEVSDEELEQLDYPPATMFWFRPQALKTIFYSYAYADFPKEPIHFDGTLAHALERTLNYVCRKSGYNVAEYISLATLRNKDFKEAVIFDWLENSLDQEKFIVVSHDATNTGAPKTALSLLNALKARNKSCLTILLRGGEQESKFSDYGPVINYNGQPLRESLLKILLENKDVKVICNTVVSYQAAKFFQSINLPVISLVHEFVSDGNFSKEMFTTLIGNSDQVIYPDDLVLQDALNNLPPVDASKIEIMPQGIYDDTFPAGDRVECRTALLKELNIPEDSFIVLGCGIAQSRKGTDILVQTAKHIFSNMSAENLHFVWVGKTPEQDAVYQNCLNELSSLALLKSNFHFVGAHQKVDRFFLAADLFALPSRYDPFPGVVLEAMAANLPVVCFDGTTGVHKAFENKVGGFVCKHLDHVDMASKILSLYKNQELVHEMGIRNQAKVRERYNFGRYTNRLLEKFAAMEQPTPSEIKFSIVMPVSDTPPNHLQKMIQSVLRQTYSNFELCIADSSSSELTRTLINYYAALDQRVKCLAVKENKSITKNLNAAVTGAMGEYLCLLDHNGILPKTVLQEAHDHIVEYFPEAIYTDENGVVKPSLDISPSDKSNNIFRLLSIRKSFLEEHIVKLDANYEDAPNYDLILNYLEKTCEIQHISKTSYQWKVLKNSTSKKFLLIETI